MASLFWNFLARICLAIISLRYRLCVKGLDQLKKLQHQGRILFLPNHPAHMDPLFLFILLWPTYRMRPLVIEYIYRLPFLKPFVKFVRGIAIPNFETSVNELKIKKAQKAMEAIAEGLKKGENFILYPGGRLKNSAKEILGGSSSAQAVVQEFPDVTIVLVRTTGLWGSSFSRALLGRSPHLSSTLWHGAKVLLKNLIFFSPRRDVLIEIEPNPADLPKDRTRVEFNRYLENWYNRYPDKEGKIQSEEPLKLVSYSFWREELPEVYQPKKKRSAQGISISDETKTKIYGEIRRIVDNPGIQIAPHMSLPADLGMDSLNIAEIITYLTKNYDVGELHPEDVETVQKVLEVAAGAHIVESSPHEVGHTQWVEEKDRPDPAPPIGRTLPEAFLNSCERMKHFTACGDDLIGLLTYQKFKRAIAVLASHFRKLPDTHIAVMLPASTGAYIAILALQLAGKIPVMLNWTLGSRYLDEMMHLSGAKIALSSWKFLDRLAHVEFGELTDRLQLLEDIRQDLSLFTKLRGALLSLCPNRIFLRAFKVDQIQEDSPAVILFTSGTEASPKGVPLTHKNIISNLCAIMQCLELNGRDVLYGVLPPFHSFGFSVTGLLTLLCGLKVAFYPDPTDSFTLAEGIERWKITIFCTPPSFLKGLFQAAKPEQLKTVRYFVTGAEKTSQELYERVEKLGTGARILEGYGITECSPVLTLTRPNIPPKGVGQPLPDVEVCTIHPESLEPLPKGTEGEICVYGPNVFHGYLGNPRDPFIEIEGKKWYKTGDLGYLDAEGHLQISGRLKRFTKVAGEMISLGAVEEALEKELIRRSEISADEHSLAICADEKEEGKPKLILFTTFSIEKETANEILKNSGLSRLVKISSVKKIDEIPVLGTGKTDYRRLQTMIEQ